MKRGFLIIIVIHAVFTVYGQKYVTVDKDGYTNIRQKPSAKSDILTMVDKYDIFYDANSACEVDAIVDDINPNWMPVHIRYGRGYEKGEYGFIYRKNIRDIEDFPTLRITKNRDLELTYQDEFFSATFIQAPLFSEKYKVDADTINYAYQNARINGEEVQHTLYKKDTLILEEISFIYKGIKQAIPKEQYQSVFSVNFKDSELAMTVYKSELDIYYISLRGGGAEEAYELTWVIDKGVVKNYNHKAICELPDLH